MLKVSQDVGTLLLAQKVATDLVDLGLNYEPDMVYELFQAWGQCYRGKVPPQAYIKNNFDGLTFQPNILQVAARSTDRLLRKYGYVDLPNGGLAATTHFALHAIMMTEEFTVTAAHHRLQKERAAA